MLATLQCNKQRLTREYSNMTMAKHCETNMKVYTGCSFFCAAMALCALAIDDRGVEIYSL